MQNKFGLDVHYFSEKLFCIHRDLEHYTPEELSRALTRLAATADKPVAWEVLSSE